MRVALYILLLASASKAQVNVEFQIKLPEQKEFQPEQFQGSLQNDSSLAVEVNTIGSVVEEVRFIPGECVAGYWWTPRSTCDKCECVAPTAFTGGGVNFEALT